MANLSSCNVEIISPLQGDSFRATIEEPVKTSLDGTRVLWTDGDCISVFSTEGDNARFALVSGAGTTSAVFSGVTPGSSPFFALYPYDDKAVCSGSEITATFPHLQHAVRDGIGCGANLSIAYSEDNMLCFKNIAGIIKFRITSDNVGEVVIEGNDGEVLAGDVTVDWNGGSPTCRPSGQQHKAIRLLPSDGKAFAPGIYHAMVLPVNFSKGIRMTLKPASLPLGNAVLSQVLPAEMVRVGDRPLNLKRSHIVNAGEMDGGRLWCYEGVKMNCIRGKADDAGSYVDLRTGRTFNPVDNPGQNGADIQMCFVQSNVRALGIVSLSGGNVQSFVNETNLRKFDNQDRTYQERDLTQNWPQRGSSSFRWLDPSEMDDSGYGALSSSADIMHLLTGPMLTSTIRDLGSQGHTGDQGQMTPGELESGARKYLLFTIRSGSADDYFGVIRFTSYDNDADYPKVCFDYKIGRGPAPDCTVPEPAAPQYENDDVPISEVLGITTTSSLYALTSEPVLIEGAKAIREIGSKNIKVWFEHAGRQYIYNSLWPENVEDMTSLQLARTPYYRELFDMPFKTYSLEFNDATVNWRDGLSESERLKVYNNMYSLATYLLKTYRGTGKTFIIQNWEGDGHLNRSALSDGQLPVAIQGMTDWVNTRQAAVSRARRDTGCDDVLVVHAFEFNYVLITNRPEPFVIDAVVPYTNCDLYSYSSYSSGKSKEVLDDIYRRVEYIRSRTPASSIYGQHNLMIGEFGYDERRIPDKGYAAAVGPESDRFQYEMIKGQLDRLVDLKMTYIFLWQLYCNGALDDNGNSAGTSPSDPSVMNDIEHCKGFWLIRPDGSRTMTYDYLKGTLFAEDPTVKAKRPQYQL